MKNYLLLGIILGTSLIACASHPKGFSYYFDEKNTGLDTLIDINGYYVSKEDCDNSFYSIGMFYSNGIFTLATTSNSSSPNIINCFKTGGKSDYCQYPSWGTYRIVNDTIKTQIYQDNGNWGERYIWFRDFLIKSPTKIILIKKYCIISGYNQDYIYTCPQVSDFFPLETKRNWRECPLLKKKWFTNKPK